MEKGKFMGLALLLLSSALVLTTCGGGSGGGGGHEWGWYIRLEFWNFDLALSPNVDGK